MRKNQLRRNHQEEDQLENYEDDQINNKIKRSNLSSFFNSYPNSKEEEEEKDENQMMMIRKLVGLNISGNFITKHGVYEISQAILSNYSPPNSSFSQSCLGCCQLKSFNLSHNKIDLEGLEIIDELIECQNEEMINQYFYEMKSSSFDSFENGTRGGRKRRSTGRISSSSRRMTNNTRSSSSSSRNQQNQQLSKDLTFSFQRIEIIQLYGNKSDNEIAENQEQKQSQIDSRIEQIYNKLISFNKSEQELKNQADQGNVNHSSSYSSSSSFLNDNNNGGGMRRRLIQTSHSNLNNNNISSSFSSQKQRSSSIRPFTSQNHNNQLSSSSLIENQNNQKWDEKEEEEEEQLFRFTSSNLPNVNQLSYPSTGGDSRKGFFLRGDRIYFLKYYFNVVFC